MLRQRVLTAIGIVAVTLVVVFLLPTWGMALAFAVLWVLGAWEWSAFGRWQQALRMTFVATLAVTLLGLSATELSEPATWVVLTVASPVSVARKLRTVSRSLIRER